MPSREQLSAWARRVIAFYEDAEAAVVKTVAQAVDRTIDGDAVETLRRQLAIRAALKREVRSLVTELRIASAKEAEAALRSAYGLSAEDVAQVLAVGGMASVAQGDIAEKALIALVSDLDARLTAAESRILRSADDAYRDVIARATAEGLLGKATRRQAAQRALDMFAARGVQPLPGWSLTGYTEMACRTAVIGASRVGKLDAMRSRGHDLAIVSSNGSGCDSCAPWEGEIISIDGATPGYPTYDEAAASGHLFGPNCGHSADVYIPGLTEEQTPLRSDPERYAALQQQRYLERGVRQYKMRGAAAMDDQAKAAAQAKVREWQARLREHVSKNNLPRLYYREQIGKAI